MSAGKTDSAGPSTSPDGHGLGPAGAMARYFINSKLTPLFIFFSVVMGVFATLALPREEEPQIIVPMIDIFVQMPGASAREVEERVTKPMEKLLWEVSGVEYIYSTSSPGMSMAVVRFYVGENEEAAIVRLNQKMFANFDLIPPGASRPLIKPRSIDDVPILALTLWSSRYGDYELRRIAAQLHDGIKQVDQVSAVEIIGGQRRQVLVELDEGKLAAHNLTALEVAGMLGAANRRLPAGEFDAENRRIVLETGEFLGCAEDVQRVVVGVSGQQPRLPRRRRSRLGRRRGAFAIRALRDQGRRRLSSGGDHRGLEAQGRERDRCGQPRPRQGRSRARRLRALGRRDRRHPQLRRDCRGEIQRTAVPHGDRGDCGIGPDLADARVPRVLDRIYRHPGHAGAYPGRVLSLRLHAQPHHAVRADFFDRPAGR